MKNLLCTILLALLFANVSAQHYDTLVGDSSHLRKMQVFTHAGVKYLYPKPKIYTFLFNIPRTLGGSARETVRKESLPALGVMLGTTAALIASDQWIAEEVQQFSRFIGVNPHRDYKSVVSLNLGSKIDVYEAPQNFNTFLYSMGEGLPPILISAGLFVHGTMKKDYRSLSVASQILQSNITMGIVTQAFKRMSGHESPFVATQRGGAWRPFPSLKTYQHNTPHYDAFPSGHMATMMSTVTVLALNYPEKKWIRKVGYSVMALVGLAMINNGVHWAGDYPLAIGLGYVSAKTTVGMNRLVSYDRWKQK